MLALAVSVARTGTSGDPFIDKFSPFTQNFPSSYNSTIFYSPESLASKTLLHTSLYHETQMLQTQIAQDWEALLKLLDDFKLTHPDVKNGSGGAFFPAGAESFPLEEYVHALFSVYSRAADLDLSLSTTDSTSISERVRILCPFLDMFNHSATSETFHKFDAKSGKIVIVSGDSEIPAGSEVFLNYGPMPNSKLALFYGFSIKDNPADSVKLHVPFPPSIPLHTEKLALLSLSHPQFSPSTPFILHRSAASLPPQLLSQLRIMPLLSIEGVEPGIGFIAKDNEVGALTALESALQSMAQAIAANLLYVADVRRGLGPEGGAEADGYDVVVLFAEGEMEVLTNALGLVRSMLAALDVDGLD